MPVSVNCIYVQVFCCVSRLHQEKQIDRKQRREEKMKKKKEIKKKLAAAVRNKRSKAKNASSVGAATVNEAEPKEPSVSAKPAAKKAKRQRSDDAMTLPAKKQKLSRT